jgi:hypothetical protein
MEGQVSLGFLKPKSVVTRKIIHLIPHYFANRIMYVAQNLIKIKRNNPE